MYYFENMYIYIKYIQLISIVYTVIIFNELVRKTDVINRNRPDGYRLFKNRIPSFGTTVK